VTVFESRCCRADTVIRDSGVHLEKEVVEQRVGTFCASKAWSSKWAVGRTSRWRSSDGLFGSLSLGIGALQAKPLDVGAGLKCVIKGCRFSRRRTLIALELPPVEVKKGKRVVVLVGIPAMDCCTAIRCGAADTVLRVSPRPGLAPARRRNTQRPGGRRRFMFLTNPISLEGNASREVTCRPLCAHGWKPDASGRRKPARGADQETTFTGGSGC
jgi:NADPH-dependent glutamate synthase beta subunit-like oxidoreductase